MVGPEVNGLSERYRSGYLEDDDWNSWGQVGEWGPGEYFPGGYLSRLLFRFSVDATQVSPADPVTQGNRPNGPAVEVLFSAIDGWFDAVRSWVAAATDQDTDLDSPLRTAEVPAEGLLLWTAADDGLDRPVTPDNWIINAHKTDYLAASAFEAVLRLAGDGEMPSAEHQLLVSARAALRRGQTRRAVIDAGTACELSLRRLYDDALALAALPIREALLSEQRTLGRLVSVLKGTAPLPADMMEGLVAPRNKATHHNDLPDRATAARAVAIAAAVVSSVEPLPVQS